ncbi:MAG: hypothetical protein H0T48_08720 [Gemmatimonadaceae bacterium]|nr:hypothetical protein [Gemmatimonadaceae bacterium]
MARIILGSYMVRYPLGAVLSWALQYLTGFRKLGHDVYFVEKSGYPKSCYDPSRDVMSDDCSYGTATVEAVLSRIGMGGKWCFVDAAGRHHGLSRERVQAVFDSADLFVDMGTHGTWLDEAARTGMRVLVDGEPGFTQMKMENKLAAGRTLPSYDFYYTNGRNIGTERSAAPTGGRQWRPLFHPVDVETFPVVASPAGAPFTTIMNWQSYEPVEYMGETYGHKDVEFVKFMTLPSLTDSRLEIAVAGSTVPRDALTGAGWKICDPHEVTRTFDSFADYVRGSCGEFSVCKSGFVRLNTGWFSDRGAVYLASGRPVVQQDTGFGAHLPCGHGLFAARDVGEAATAIDTIAGDYERHSRWAREVAAEYLDARRVLGGMLEDLGM